MAQQEGDEEEDGLVYTLEEALTSVGIGKFQYMALCYAGLGFIAEAAETQILSFIGPALRSQWALSPTQESLMTTIVFVGMLIGAIFWGFISDTYGRRKGLLSVAIVTAVSAALSAFSPNYSLLLVVRMLVGFGVGGRPIYGSWFFEFVPSQNRGMWTTICIGFWTIGTILEAFLALMIMPRMGWRWLLALSSIPSFAALLLFVFTVESPRYLCAIGRTNDACDILKKIAVVNKAQLPPGKLVSSQLTKELLSPGKNKISSVKSGFSSLLVLLSPALRRNTLLLWVVYTGNAFSYYGIVLLTSLFSSGRCQRSSIALHTNDDQSLYTNVLINSLAAILVEKVGRKFTMALMYALYFLFLLPLLAPQLPALTTALLFGARAFIMGSSITVCVYCEEIYPTSIRSTGMGVATSAGRTGAMLSPIFAVQLVRGCHQMTAIISFEAVLVLSAVSVMLFSLETKGRELIDTLVL
ncbi:organic cation/carnitine transporter 7-like isoform X2 [Lycium ferocissimum]|uniref:organic cation/carnitine transporter 7-like isoform X2 n=1 Tax=Lycium ferocissimum TaxID=112874 RepID=UPI0028153B2D|nr:organic cation/carnitine transporter 7-like isoform X2 [Lycium ferocissimum]